MFVMHKDMFVDYSEWLFAILTNLESRISMNNYNAQKSVLLDILLSVFLTFILLSSSKTGP